MDLNIQQQPMPAYDPNSQNVSGGQEIKNVKRMIIGDGRVRIENGALIIRDENGIDRVLIGFLKNGF